MLNWCLFSRSELEKLLGTDLKKGLSASAVLMRSTENDAVAREIKDFFYPLSTFFRSLGGILSDFSVMMLLCAAVICCFLSNLGARAVGIIIGFILVCSLIRTFLVIYSEKSVRESTDDDSYLVVRDGKLKTVKGASLVRGDVVVLRKGDIVPCTLRLVDSDNLSVIEKYNGKRVKPVSKDAMFFPMKMTDIPLRMRKNMVYEGSAVTSGEALAVVTDERMTLASARRIINIADDVAEFYVNKRKSGSEYGTRLLRRNAFGTDIIRDGGYNEDTSVTATAERVAAIMRLCGLGVGTVIFLIGILSSVELAEGFMYSVAVISCAPSVLYELCIACAFAVGGIRLKAQGAHIKNFECAEKLVLSKNLLCCGSTCFNVDRMVTEACYTGRNLEFKTENASYFARLCEMLLCTSELYYKTDKNGIQSIGGDIEGLAALEGARNTGIAVPGNERRFLDRIAEFHDINGTLVSSFCNYRSRTVLISKGSVAQLLRKCKYYDIDGTPEILEQKMRDRILDNAKSYENNESCRVVAVCYKYCDRVTRSDFKDGFVFAGFVVFGTRLNYDSEKYVSLLRRNGITPAIFSNVVSDMVIGDAKKIGVLGENDNYITSKSLSALDEKIYSDDLASYTLYMGLGGLQKKAVVRNRKYSEKLVVVAADKPADAFDMSEGDVLISFGREAPKTLRRISDIHSENTGIGMIFRTICLCRNMIRCTALSTGYLVFAQISAMLFCLLGVISSFFNSGRLPFSAGQLLGSILITDLVISLLTAFIKTPASIISDKPSAFLAYYMPENIIPKAVFAGISCGFCAFFAYFLGFLKTDDHFLGTSCAFFVMFLAKCFVSLFCIMRTSTFRAPALFPYTCAAGELICGIILAVLFGKSMIPTGCGFRILGLCVVLSVVPTLLTSLYIRLEGTGKKQ